MSPFKHPGTRDYFPTRYRNLRDMTRRVEALFESYGYQPVMLPELEEDREASGEADLAPEADTHYAFTDLEGRRVRLRPDFTHSVVRLAARKLAHAPSPLRLCYTGKVFRFRPRASGQLAEFMQVGAELLGTTGDFANAEIVHLAVQTLLTLGVPGVRIRTTDPAALRTGLLGYHSPHAVIEYDATLRPPSAAYAGLYFIIEAVAPPGSADGEQVATIGPTDARNAYVSVGAGGRYDGLFSAYPQSPVRHGVGFAVEIEKILRLVRDHRGETESELVAGLVQAALAPTSPTAMCAAQLLAETLRVHGMRVELSPTPLDDAALRARADTLGALWVVAVDEGGFDVVHTAIRTVSRVETSDRVVAQLLGRRTPMATH